LQASAAADLSKSQWEITIPGSVILTPFIPTVDGYFLIEPPTDALLKDAASRTSVMIGVNRDEGFFFLAYSHEALFPVKAPVQPLSKENFNKVVADILDSDLPFVTNSVIFEYTIPHESNTASPNYLKQSDNVMGDLAFKCPVVELAKTYAERDKPTYVYLFNHRTSDNAWPQWMGVMHGYEIDHVFGVPLGRSSSYTYDEQRLSGKMVKYWTNFAKSGDPNRGDAGDQGSGLYAWPPYTMKDRKILVMNTTNMGTESGLRDRQCDFWKEVVPKLRKAAAELKKCGGSQMLAGHLFFIPSSFVFLFRVLVDRV